MSTTRITGEAVVLVSQYTSFDPAQPNKTPAHDFVFIRHDAIEDGGFANHWCEKGYRHVGYATIQIDLLDRETMTAGAVSALRAQKAKLLADTEVAANRIEQQIQNLLALTMEPTP